MNCKHTQHWDGSRGHGCWKPDKSLHPASAESADFKTGHRYPVRWGGDGVPERPGGGWTVGTVSVLVSSSGCVT